MMKLKKLSSKMLSIIVLVGLAMEYNQTYSSESQFNNGINTFTIEPIEIPNFEKEIASWMSTMVGISMYHFKNSPDLSDLVNYPDEIKTDILCFAASENKNYKPLETRFKNDQKFNPFSLMKITEGYLKEYFPQLVGTYYSRRNFDLNSAEWSQIRINSKNFSKIGTYMIPSEIFFRDIFIKHINNKIPLIVVVDQNVLLADPSVTFSETYTSNSNYSSTFLLGFKTNDTGEVTDVMINSLYENGITRGYTVITVPYDRFIRSCVAIYSLI